MLEVRMSYRAIAAAACVLALTGCQMSGAERGSLASPVAPSLLSATTADGPQGKPDVPFSGVVTGEAVFDFATNPKVCAAGFTTITTARGQASHMGLTTWLSQHCVGLNSELLDAELVLTAANGDQIYGTYTGSCAGSMVIGELVICSGNVVFAGGTGRFEDASGTAELRAAIVFEGFTDPSWPGRWEWNGSIRY